MHDKIDRVLCVAPNHRPWGNRVIREAEILVDSGYSVTSIMRTDHRTEYRGIDIIPALRAVNRTQRILNQPALFLQALRYKADIYHLHNPDMIVVALMLKLFGKRVIYDTHEDYSRRLMVREWVPGVLRKPLGMVATLAEWLLSRVADATLVTQENQVHRFAPRACLLRNAPYLTAELLTSARDIAAKLSSESGVFRLIYVGGISRQRGLFTMLDALVTVNKQANVRLWLAGPEFDEVLTDARKHHGWDHVDFLGTITHEEVFAYISKSDMGLAVLSDVGDHSSARPSKLFEYMAMGKPFVASDFRLWREFIEPRQAGWWIKPDDGVELSRVLADIIQTPDEIELRGKSGKAFISEFNWQTESQVLLDLYNKLLPQ